MKAYFINAKDEFVVQINFKGYVHMQELLNCTMLELYPYSLNGNDIWTDEEGNLKEYNYFFELDGKFMVSGNAVILSCDDEGECADVKNLTIEELKSRVKFLGKRYIEQNGMGFSIREYQ